LAAGESKPSRHLPSIANLVIAFDGKVVQYMDSTVTHVIVRRTQKWDDEMQSVADKYPHIIFVRVDWITECGKANKNVDIAPYVVTKV